MGPPIERASRESRGDYTTDLLKFQPEQREDQFETFEGFNEQVQPEENLVAMDPSTSQGGA